MKKAILALSLLIPTAGVSLAEAGTMSLQPVSGNLQAFQTPPPPGTVAANDVIPGLWGYLNGNLVLNGALGTTYLVQFTLVGSESGWQNQLKETQGGTVLIEPNHQGSSISYTTVGTGSAEFLKFQFETIAGSTQPKLVNGTDPDGAANGYIVNGGTSAARTFFVSFCIDPTKSGNQQKNLACNSTDLDGATNGIQTPTTGNIAWLALDDSGAGPNDNHDDWVGYVKVSAVPDAGSTLGLLGLAMAGLGAVRRRLL